MDLTLFIVVIILVFFIYYFIKVITELRYDVKSLSNKCQMTCSNNNEINSNNINSNNIKIKKEMFETLKDDNDNIINNVKTALEYIKNIL